MKKRVLIVTTIRWLSAAQLAIAFSEVGWSVDALCPPGHPMALTKAISRAYDFNALVPRRSLRAGLLASEPDLVVAMDDLAASHLHGIHRAAVWVLAYGERRRPSLMPDAHRPDSYMGEASLLNDLLSRSLGRVMSYDVVESRAGFAAAAGEEGVRTPGMASPASEPEFKRALAACSYPVVLKADGTSGGEGVRIAATPEEALHHYTTLRRPLPAATVAKQAGLDGNMNLVVPWLLRKPRTVSLQAFIRGRDANIAVACWKGEVLASISVEALHTWCRNGPCAVVRLIDQPLMLQAAARMVRRLGVSGLCGFDFILDEHTSEPFLIEMNPRATPICHLALGGGHDLVAALCAAVEGGNGESTMGRPLLTDKTVLGLFPLSWQIDPASEFLAGAYRDVPHGEPALVRTGLARPRRPTRAQLQRFWTRVSSMGRSHTLPAEQP